MPFYINVIIALVAGLWIFRTGLRLLGSLSAPPAPPPPPGELRKVKITYRCELCGTEVRMTAATDTDPEPPRHCMDEMTLIANAED